MRLFVASALAACAFPALVLPLASAQAQAPTDYSRTIRVRGHAEREVTPDMATISIGVTTRAPQATDALDANSAAIAKVIAAAKQSGIEAKDIGTSAINVSEDVRSRRDGSGTVTDERIGFVVMNTVAVRVRELGKLGTLLNQFVNDGANRINGLSFDKSDRDMIDAELRIAAVSDARATAARLAEAAGAKLGPVTSVTYPPRSGFQPMEYGAMRAAKAAVPVEAGALTLTSEVETTWSLQ